MKLAPEVTSLTPRGSQSLGWFFLEHSAADICLFSHLYFCLCSLYCYAHYLGGGEHGCLWEILSALGLCYSFFRTGYVIWMNVVLSGVSVLLQSLWLVKSLPWSVVYTPNCLLSSYPFSETTLCPAGQQIRTEAVVD